MDKNSVHRTNIIGAGEVGSAVTIDMDKNSIHKTNSLFWDTKGNDILGATALPYYGAFVSEEKCQLFGDVSGKRCWRSAAEPVIPCSIWGTQSI